MSQEDNYVEFVTPLHKRGSRDYIGRVTEHDKAKCSEIAKKYGAEYWDGNREYGYGGYSYDGRWSVVAEGLAAKYNLTPESNVLDIGCGKGFLLFEIQKLIPGISISGLDLSTYAIENAKPEVKSQIKHGHAKELPFNDSEFDLVISNTTFHNLKIMDLFSALREVERVKKANANSWICVESFRNEKERANLLYWQLTCESFYSVEEWKWIYNHIGYKGDFEFIFFE